jgi:hypothetical protein
MRTLTIAGAGPARGLDLGRALAQQLRDASAALKDELAAAGHSPDSLGTRLMASGLGRTAERLTPDLWDEVTSMAASARIPLEDVMMLTFIDELWGLTRPAGCSVLVRLPAGASGPRAVEIGQTMDLPAWASGRAVVLRVQTPGAPTAIVLTYPGSIGLCGANDAGVGVAVNALNTGPIDTDGLGVSFVTRHLLSLRSLADAEEFIVGVPHAAGQAYTVMAPDGIATFEADAREVRRITPADATMSIHTNHVLGVEGARSSTSSRARLDALAHACATGMDWNDILAAVEVDGERWGDRHVTFGAFRAVEGEDIVRVIDAAAWRAGRRDWDRVTFR